jgi:hypothetical protein
MSNKYYLIIAMSIILLKISMIIYHDYKKNKRLERIRNLKKKKDGIQQ